MRAISSIPVSFFSTLGTASGLSRDCFSGDFIAVLQRGRVVEEAARCANAVGATAGVLDWDSKVASMAHMGSLASHHS